MRPGNPWCTLLMPHQEQVTTAMLLPCESVGDKLQETFPILCHEARECLRFGVQNNEMSRQTKLWHWSSGDSSKANTTRS